ncbi:MAG TPA: ABC transporter substrate-binding protein [Gemmatimonadaceae bacterium]|nr:ABC transporter substrate-binding protein [Gemmatimonadaceae bacterium]
MLTACGGGSPTLGRAGADTAYVGVAVGLTNPERYAHLFEGVELAFDSLNKLRPKGTPPLALRRAPAAANSPVRIATAFRDDPRIVAVIGHTESDATIAAAPVYADRAHGGKDPVPVVTLAGAVAVTRVSPWIYRVNVTIAEQGRVLARYADSLGLKRAGVLYRNEPAGKDFEAAFTQEFAKHGGVVIERDPFTEDIWDYDAYAKRLVKNGAQIIAVAGNSPQARATIRSLRMAGGQQPVLGTNGPAAADTGDFRGLHHIVLYSPDRPVAVEGGTFAARFRTRYDVAPDHWAALGFDAAMLIARAVHDAGAERAAIHAWLGTIGKARPAHPGATGSIAFDDNRDPMNKQLLVAEVTR